MSANDDPRVPPGADMEGYLRELADFVGFGAGDAAAIRASAPAVLENERP